MRFDRFNSIPVPEGLTLTHLQFGTATAPVQSGVRVQVQPVTSTAPIIGSPVHSGVRGQALTSKDGSSSIGIQGDPLTAPLHSGVRAQVGLVLCGVSEMRLQDDMQLDSSGASPVQSGVRVQSESTSKVTMLFKLTFQ